ncbi:hypothetical protein EMPS_03127 [Entomortierella parvispora]|uniref:Ankyrin n=1 Tax=Entomortierella parvispora TaxID=205924 RepID=A0A9P3LUA5_9FUNG|nr:hypothetical protein EMPS_03127 [Entomortierella parvispora]
MSDDEGASNNELLLAACREDNLGLLDEVLSSEPDSFSINHTDGLGNSALHYAAKYASTDCLEILLYFDGIDINIKNRLEWETPLHKAVAYEDPETALTMTRLLVEAGASTTALNKQKQTPADKAPSDTHGEVKEYLETVRIGSNYDARDIPADDDDDSDGVASDED